MVEKISRKSIIDSVMWQPLLCTFIMKSTKWDTHTNKIQNIKKKKSRRKRRKRKKRRRRRRSGRRRSTMKLKVRAKVCAERDEE